MAEPGWYPDPSGTLGLRFWDGRRWTEKVSAAAEQTSLAVGRSSSAAGTALKNAGFRTRAGLLVLAALGVVAMWALPATIFGLSARLTATSSVVIFIVGLVGALVSLRTSAGMATKATGGTMVSRTSEDEDHRWLVHTVAELSSRAEISTLDVVVYPSSANNVFVTGPNKTKALLVVSDSMLTGMNRQQLSAVLAHEITHVANGDMVTMNLIQGVLNTFVTGLPRLIGRLLPSGGDQFYTIVSSALRFTIGLPTTLIALWFSRRREYRADTGAAALVGTSPVIAALTAMRDDVSPSGLPDEISSLGIRAGRSADSFQGLFSSHPDTSLRIASLEV